MSWSPYPTEPRQRRSTIVRDVLAASALVLLAWLGRRVYRLVDDLRAVTEAVNTAGSSVQGGFQTAADALSGTPLVGDDISGALESAGAASGGNVMELALTGDTAIHRLVYRDEHDPERRRLLAMRAALSLPADHLLRFSTDPIGDVVRGEHDALVAALLSDAGLAPARLPAGY